MAIKYCFDCDLDVNIKEKKCPNCNGTLNRICHCGSSTELEDYQEVCEDCR